MAGFSTGESPNPPFSQSNHDRTLSPEPVRSISEGECVGGRWRRGDAKPAGAAATMVKIPIATTSFEFMATPLTIFPHFSNTNYAGKNRKG
jgi:hypothetical protein